MFHPPPLLTVILPHYCCENFLPSAAGSILAQTVSDLTLVLVDDHSPGDGWLNALTPFFDDRRLCIYRTDRTVGPYRIYNRLLPQVYSPFIGFQDADDLSHPDRFARLINACRRTHAQVIGSSYIEIDEQGRNLGKRRMGRYANLWSQLGKTHIIHHGTSLVRREVFGTLGGYDGTTRFGADTDFMLRAAQLFRVRNLPDYLYSYRIRPQSLTGSPETGLESEARRRYLSSLKERRAQWRRAQGRAELIRQLQAQPNDVDFQIEAVPLPGLGAAV